MMSKCSTVLLFTLLAFLMSLGATEAVDFGGSSQQFIGSTISLTSKTDIRYEGIFYALDLREATISLAKVKSFGTEDRPTEIPIPAKDEIYEFIVFRGSDIKSIDVLAPPKK